VDAGYYPRQVGEKGELSKNERREHKKRRAVRTRLGGERSEPTIPDVEALEGKIWDLRTQLDCAAQIIVAKDNELERLHKEKEKLQKPIIDAKRGCAKLGCPVEGRSLASWDRCKRGKGANVTNGD